VEKEEKGKGRKKLEEVQRQNDAAMMARLQPHVGARQ
jgi:hypothetical protein